MATATYSMPVQTPGPNHTGAMMLPPIHEAVPQIFSTGPRDHDGYAPDPPHPNPAADMTAFNALNPPSFNTSSATPKRRRTSHPLEDAPPSGSESGLSVSRPHALDGPVGMHGRSYQTANGRYEGVPAMSELKLGQGGAPYIPPLRANPSQRFNDEAESLDRPTLPSIFGNDQHPLTAGVDRERPSYPASAYEPPVSGHPYPSLQPEPPSPAHSAAASYQNSAYPNQGYPAARPDYLQQRHGSYPGPGVGGRGDRPQFLTPDQHSMSYDGLVEYPEEQKTKRRRGNLPKSTTDILKGWFHEHLDHPYPSEEEKQILMCRTRLTMSQISNWFINCRRRHLPMYNRQMRAELIASEEGGSGREDRGGEDERMRGH